MKAVVYSSQTGFTEKYASWIGNRTGLPVYSIRESGKHLRKGDPVIFASHLSTRKLTDLRDVMHVFDVRYILSVGINRPDPKTASYLRAEQGIPDQIPYLMLYGGIERQKIRGMRRMMLTAMIRSLEKDRDRDREDDNMLELLMNGGDWTSEDQLEPFYRWYQFFQEEQLPG